MRRIWRPLAVVALSYVIAAGSVYLLIQSVDLVVNGQTTGILIILMFGAVSGAHFNPVVTLLDCERSVDVVIGDHRNPRSGIGFLLA